MRAAFPHPLRGRRRLLLAGGAALLAIAVVLAGPWPPVTAVASTLQDPAVEEARAELESANRTLDARAADLDAAAAVFEQARAHHLRLSEEQTEASEAVRRADATLTTARQGFAARVAAAYRHPEAGLVLSEAVLVAPDPRTAMHRVALVGTLSTNDTRLESLAAARERAAARLRQHEILDSGVAASAADLQAEADALAAAVNSAQQQAQEAQSGLEAAEEEARRRAAEALRMAKSASAARAAEEARRAEAARAAEAARRADLVAAARSAAPPPSVDGKVCPVGMPNGFIDSWGFPRSGGRTHQGVDIFAPRGTALFAVADGTVQRLTNNSLGGLSVHLVDDSGDRYYYAHLDAFAVAAGTRVEAGDVIGTVGNTGNARTTPPHLHWQFHPGNGPPVNPYSLAHALCRG